MFGCDPVAEEFVLLIGLRMVRLAEACHSRVVNQVLRLELPVSNRANKMSEISIITIMTLHIMLKNDLTLKDKTKLSLNAQYVMFCH